jgi:hypothetical protein
MTNAPALTSTFSRDLFVALLFLLVCAAPRAQAQTPDPSSRTATLLAYVEAMHQQNWDEVVALTHPEGIQALAPQLRQMLHAFEVEGADTLGEKALYTTFLELGGGRAQAFDVEGIDVTPSTYVLGFIEAEGDTT